MGYIYVDQRGYDTSILLWDVGEAALPQQAGGSKRTPRGESGERGDACSARPIRCFVVGCAPVPRSSSSA